MNSIAKFSPCRLYRYTLWRKWIGGKGYALVIGLNPSTADEVTDDPTVRRCSNYAKAWGYASLCMTNLFAYRATDPVVMKAVAEPIGPDNDRYLAECAQRAAVVVAAWGNHGTYRGRAGEVLGLLGELHFLRLTQSGQPAHPLYLRKTLTPTRWTRN